MTLVSFLLRTHLFVLVSAVIILVQGTALTKTTDVADQITELEARLETMYSSNNILQAEVEVAEERLSQLYNTEDAGVSEAAREEEEEEDERQGTAQAQLKSIGNQLLAKSKSMLKQADLSSVQDLIKKAKAAIKQQLVQKKGTGRKAPVKGKTKAKMAKKGVKKGKGPKKSSKKSPKRK